MVEAAPRDIHETFAAFDRLLFSTANGPPPARAEAMLYSTYRTALIDSSYRRHLPGFVIQCLSVLKYREFISLLDPDPENREDFVARSLQQCRDFYSDNVPADRFDRSREPNRSAREWIL